MTIENANSHPYKVTLTSESDGMFANSHPYKVTLEGGGGMGGKVVDELPAEGEQGYIYLILKESTPEGDIYDEYMWVLLQDGETYGWEHIGATNEVNLDVVKTLTTDDYNWNRGTHSATEPYNCVAIWLLDDGLYTGSPDITICPVQNWSMGNYSGIMMNRKSTGGLGYGTIVSFGPGGAYMWSGVNGGVAAFEQRLDNPTIEQTTGQDSTRVMSQKAITDAINENVGQARVLTADDYDYPSNNPDGVALWNLAPGVYKRETTAKVYMTNNYFRAYDIYLVGGESSSNYITEWAFDDGGVISKTVNDTGAESNARAFLTDASVVDNLTSTSSTKPLSAKQGKVLKGLIDGLAVSGAGAPTTATVGTVGQLYEDTTNGKLYQCTAVSGGTYTWVEVGGGSGGGNITFYISYDDVPHSTGVNIRDKNIYADAGLTTPISAMDLRDALDSNNTVNFVLIDLVNGGFPIKCAFRSCDILSAEDLENYSGMTVHIDGAFDGGYYECYFEGPDPGVFGFTLFQ